MLPLVTHLVWETLNFDKSGSGSGFSRASAPSSARPASLRFGVSLHVRISALFTSFTVPVHAGTPAPRGWPVRLLLEWRLRKNAARPRLGSKRPSPPVRELRTLFVLSLSRTRTPCFSAMSVPASQFSRFAQASH